MTLSRVSTVRLKVIHDSPCPYLSAEYMERWIVNDNWTYTADLSPFAQSYGKTGSEKTLLVFYGIDTIANIVCDS